MESNALLFGYTGAYCDTVTDGYLLGSGYRMYLPELIRFNSPDSWSPFGRGGIHPYAYCAGDPINHADPSGHFSVLSIMVEAIVAEEAANVAATVRQLVDAVAAARGEEAVDAGLAAASATRAPAVVIDEEIASFSRAAEVPEKRPRLEGSGMRRVPGTDEPGPSGQQAPGFAPPFEAFWRTHVRGGLDALEQSMRENMDPPFNEGQPTLRELYAENDFETLIQRIDRFGPAHVQNHLEEVLDTHLVRLRDIRALTSSEWTEERDRADSLERQIKENERILDGAWDRNPRNPNRPVPN